MYVSCSFDNNTESVLSIPLLSTKSIGTFLFPILPEMVLTCVSRCAFKDAKVISIYVLSSTQQTVQESYHFLLVAISHLFRYGTSKYLRIASINLVGSRPIASMVLFNSGRLLSHICKSLLTSLDLLVSSNTSFSSSFPRSSDILTSSGFVRRLITH